MSLPYSGGGPQIYDFGPSSLCLWGNLGPGLKKLVSNPEDIREGKFLPQWSEAFPWVEYDDATSVMFCKVCHSYPSKADKGGSFLLFSVSFGQVQPRSGQVKNLSTCPTGQVKKLLSVYPCCTWTVQ